MKTECLNLRKIAGWGKISLSFLAAVAFFTPMVLGLVLTFCYFGHFGTVEGGWQNYHFAAMGIGDLMLLGWTIFNIRQVTK